MSYIFGGNTGVTPEQLKQRRAIAQAMMKRGGTPQSVGEGLDYASGKIAGALIAKRAGKDEKAGQDAASSIFDSVFASTEPTFSTSSGGVGAVANAVLKRTAASKSDTGKASAPTGGKAEFIQAMMPHAMRVSEQTGLDPRLVIAQSAQETGWGKHAPGNNYFGIKSHGKSGGNTMATNEVVNGKTVRINDSFRGYEDMGDSVDGYASFLQENPRYRGMLSAPDLDSQVAELGKSGYATDPNYARSVASIAKSIQLPGGGAQAMQAQAQPGIAELPSEYQYSGPSVSEIQRVLAQPFLSDEQRAIAAQALERAQAATDPQQQLKMRLAYDEAIRKREGGGASDLPTAVQELQWRAEQGGLEPGTPEYEAFVVNGGGDPATYRALKMQAIDAGYEPGSPQYAEFMATRGAGLQAGAKTTATNMANIETGGDAERVKAAGAAQGKSDVESSSELAEMERNLPGLMEVAGQLDKLADEATYTWAGQAYNEGRKQLGLSPTEGAKARTEYIAVVDNQVLPLLRQTFGAAFTAKEGDTLRATLGDPDKSPSEKKAVLNAFIEQKKRDVTARGGQVPSSAGAGGFEAFSADPSAQRAAERYGVTLEEMWAIKQGNK
ncbi:glycoside hydrolase family 73 protein [Sulfitobacter sp. 1A12157]|uniref:glycoside hydrolase family 73 protein n=1 Tax=Sulfitobacter sp. 1A12157 TaxID=3368594 RepID=UPI003746405F